MNKPKEIYLTIFTFPRYNLWKRTGKDREASEFIFWSVFYYIFIVIGHFLVFDNKGTLYPFVWTPPIIGFMILWLYVRIRLEKVIKGDKE